MDPTNRRNTQIICDYHFKEELKVEACEKPNFPLHHILCLNLIASSYSFFFISEFCKTIFQTFEFTLNYNLLQIHIVIKLIFSFKQKLHLFVSTSSLSPFL